MKVILSCICILSLMLSVVSFSLSNQREIDDSIPCERFVKHSVSTAAVSIITPKRIRPKMPCDQK